MSDDRERNEQKKPWRPRPTNAIRAFLVFLVVLTTGFRFENGPIYDDTPIINIVGVIHQPKRALEAFGQPTMYISKRPAESTYVVDTYRPIPVLSFFLDSAISGKNLWAYHLTNLVLHATCVLLLFSLIRRWLGGGKLKAATVGAIFFAVHPWLAEAHVWINGRSDPLALMFGLGAALVLLQRPPTPLRLVIAGVLFLGGLLSKEVLLATVPAFFFLDPKGRAPLRTRLLRIAPLILSAGIYVTMRIRVLGAMRTHTDDAALKEAVLRGPAIVFDAVRYLLVPTIPFLRSLRDDFDRVPRPVLYAAFVALAAVALLIVRARRRLTSGPFAALFFAGSLGPIAGVSVVLWVGYGRYLYLPAAAFALVLAEIIALALPRLRPRGRRIASVAIFVYLATQATLLISYTRDMKSDETLYLGATEHRPNQAYGWGYLGLAYTAAGEEELAIGALRRATELDPSEVLFSGRLSLALAHFHRCDEVRALARESFERFRDRRAAVYHFALALCSDQVEGALHHLRACLILNPARDECAMTLSDLLTTHTHAERARAALREMMKETPEPSFDSKWRSLTSSP